MSRLIVFGSANMDLVVPVNRLPVAGETVLGGDLVTAFGGKGANQAVAAARLGAQVDLVAKLGTDAFGRRYLDHLRAEGIGLSHVTADPSRPTGCALILVEEKGQNLIVVSPGSNHALRPEDVDASSDLLQSADLVLLQLEIPLETVAAIIRHANGFGVPVLLNPSPVHPEFRMEGFRIAYLVLNTVETEQMSGGSCRDARSLERAISVLHRQGADRVIVTRGAQDTVISDGKGIDRVSAFAVDVVDTVGAGDTFAGALAVAIGEGMDLRSAARFANGAAALATTRLGAQTSMPRRTEVESLVRQESGHV